MQKFLLTILAIVLAGLIVGCGGGGSDLAPAEPKPEEQVVRYGNLEGFIPDCGEGGRETVSVSASVSGENGNASRSLRDDVYGGKVSIVFQDVASSFVRGKYGLDPDNASFTTKLPYGQYVVTARAYPAGNTRFALIDVQPLVVVPESQPIHVSLRLRQRGETNQEVQVGVGYADEAPVVYQQGMSKADEFQTFALMDIAEHAGKEILATYNGLLYKNPGIGDWLVDTSFVQKAVQIVSHHTGLYALDYNGNIQYNPAFPAAGWSTISLPMTVQAISQDHQSHTLYAGGKDIMSSPDGVSWTVVLPDTDVTPKSLFTEGKNIVFYNDQANTFTRTRDGGITWFNFNSPAPLYKPWVRYISDNHLVVLDTVNRVLYNGIAYPLDGVYVWQDISPTDVRGMGGWFRWFTINSGRVLICVYDNKHHQYSVREFAAGQWRPIAYLGLFSCDSAVAGPDGLVYVNGSQYLPENPIGSYSSLLTLDTNSIVSN